MSNLNLYNDNQHTFADIFGAEFASSETSVKLSRIIIPRIQRDYAQGRSTSEAVRIRTNFLKALHEAIEGVPITLDFVYGNIDKDGIMTPLDGQQRLTTLFLLHWFAAKKCGIQSDEYKFLYGFSYESRSSSRDFCKRLISFSPSFTSCLSDEIENQEWFPLDWRHDPTIFSMLTMLNAIQEQFSDIDNLWHKLKEGKISFYFLAIKDMGLKDDIYIKMNSRGKPLTLFEHFKAEFERTIEKQDKSVAKRIISKIDREWTDLLWPYKGENNVTDDEFLKYFKFICDIICYHNNESPRISDEFDLISSYFTGEQSVNHILLLESYFDCWLRIKDLDITIDDFFKNYISYDHTDKKIKIEGRYSIDVFHDCLSNYGETISGRNRKFPLNRVVLLYAFITYLLNIDIVDKEQFSERLRHVHNLILNSSDEISDSETRTGGNRMPAILEQVEHIILTGIIAPDNKITNNFNVYQLKEEQLKIEWIHSHPDDVKALYKLEDHNLLHGQIGIIGLENIFLTPRFESLFKCDFDLIDCALNSIDNYGQLESNGWRWQFGSKNESSWKFLFHKSSAKNFENTQKSLLILLGQTDYFTNDYLDSLRVGYLEKCERDNLFDWRYYRLKYNSFRDTDSGKYSYNDFNNKPYCFLLMKTPVNVSEYSYDPFLFEIDSSHISRDHYGRILLYEKYIVSNGNSYFRIKSNVNGQDELLKEIDIPQVNGIDTVNRIILGRESILKFIDEKGV